jgi:hypothetical protein
MAQATSTGNSCASIHSKSGGKMNVRAAHAGGARPAAFPPRWLGRSASFFLLAALPAPALASAFPQPRGEGRVIATAVYSVSDKGFDSSGDVIDIPDYDQFNIYLQGEYGLTDDLTLILSPSYRNISVEGTNRDTSGLNFIEAGARYRVASLGSGLVSLQGTVRIPGETFDDRFAQINQEGVETDFRVQYGSGFGENGGAGFFSAEAGYRFRAEEPPDEFHLDLTLGIQAAPRLRLIGSLYNVFSNGRGSGIFDSYRYHNLYATAVYDVSERVSVQFGGQATIAGENALRERGLVGGLWFRF